MAIDEVTVLARLLPAFETETGFVPRLRGEPCLALLLKRTVSGMKPP